MRKIYVSFLLIVIAFSVTASPAFAACTSTFYWGYRECSGYFTGTYYGQLSGTGDVFTTGIYSTSANSFITTVQGHLNGTNTQNRNAAAGLIGIMMSQDAAFTSINQGVTYAQNNFNNWANLVRAYDTAGLIDWSYTRSVSPGMGNSSYHNGEIMSEGESDTMTYSSIRFRQPSGSTRRTFYIYKDCGNPTGDGLTPLGPTATPVPPTPTPTRTPTPTIPSAPTNTPTPTPTAPPVPTPTIPGGIAPGSITNLSFGISNFRPWIQGVCGNIRMDNGINNPIPSTAQGGAYMLVTAAQCSTPGLLFGGAGTVNLGQGAASSTNWQPGDSSYPEEYVSSTRLGTAYSVLLQKFQAGGTTTITDLATVCTLTNCTLPAALPSGVYRANSAVNLRNYTVGAGRQYVFLINGVLTFQGAFTIPAGSDSSAMFSVADNIVVPYTVGVASNATQTSLDGIFSTDRSFIINTNPTVCTDLRLNIGGAVIVNASRTGGSLQNNRDLCGDDGLYPTLGLTYRLDLVLNTSPQIAQQNLMTQEIAP